MRFIRWGNNRKPGDENGDLNTLQNTPQIPDIKGKAIPLTGREGPYGYKTSRLPHFLDNRLTDGGKVVSPKRRPPLPQNYSWYSFLLEAESNPGP
jgi:hypothetical protein